MQHYLFVKKCYNYSKFFSKMKNLTISHKNPGTISVNDGTGIITVTNDFESKWVETKFKNDTINYIRTKPYKPYN